MAINKLKYLVSFIKKNGIRILFNRIDDSKLRFIFAVGRSGTTWLGKGLSFTETPIQYISEPIPHFLPRLNIGSEDDISFVSLDEKLGFFHPLILMLKKIQSGLESDDFIPNYFQKKVIRDQDEKHLILIKEVHSHLVLPQLIKKLPQAKFIFIYRNPLYVLDSLLTYKDDSIGLWEQEYFELVTYYNLNDFIDEFSISENSRNRKLVSIALQNNFLQSIENSNCIKVSYNSLCIDPSTNFKNIADFFNFKYGINAIENLKTTFESTDEVFDHTSVHRNTFSQVDRDFRILTESEVEEFKLILTNLENLGFKTGL